MMNEDGSDKTIYAKVGSFVAFLAAITGIVAATISGLQYYQEQSRPDLTGRWKITNVVEETTYNPYRGLELGYVVSIIQDGATFKGQGEKYLEDGGPISGDARVPIRISGQVEDDDVSATFKERGTLRETSGHFSWELTASGDTLKGTFAHTAANSSGTSVAVQLEK